MEINGHIIERRGKVWDEHENREVGMYVCPACGRYSTVDEDPILPPSARMWSRATAITQAFRFTCPKHHMTREEGDYLIWLADQERGGPG